MATKNERRQDARDRARAAREATRRREARTRILVRSGIVVGLLGLATAVALVITSSIQPPGPGPRNAVTDGVRIADGLKAQRSAALEAGATPSAPPSSAAGDPIDIRLYVDFHCPGCGAFESTNGPYLEKLAKAGKATLDYHPIAVLDRASLGSRYSTRSAAAVACVADRAPDSYFEAVKALFAAQPAEGTTGPTNRALAATLGGLPSLSRRQAVENCVVDQRFAPWVGRASARALGDTIPGTDGAKVTSTPTIVVDGEVFPLGEGSLEEYLVERYGDSVADEVLSAS